MIVRELLTVIGVKVELESFDAAEGLFERLKEKAAEVSDEVKGIAIAATAAAGAAIAANLGIVRSTVRVADAAKYAAERFGLTVQQVQELEYAAKRTDVPLEAIGTGLKVLQRNAAEAFRGDKGAVASFARLGVNIRGANGQIKPTMQLFGEIADKLKGVQNESERTKLAFEILGKGDQLLPLLREGSAGMEELFRQARMLGGVMSSELVETADAVGDAWTDIRMIFRGFKNDISGELLPVVRMFLESFVAFMVENRETISSSLKMVSGFVAAIGKAIHWMGSTLYENIRVLAIYMALLSPYFIKTAQLLWGLGKLFFKYSLLLKSFKLLIWVLGKLGLLKLFAWFMSKIALLSVRAAASFLAMHAALLLVALIIEDIFVYLSGGESAIGALTDKFLEMAEAPDAHWMVKTAAFILKTFRDVIDWIDNAFKEFFDAKIETGSWGLAIYDTVKTALVNAVTFWWDYLKTYIRDHWHEVMMSMAPGGGGIMSLGAGQAAKLFAGGAGPDMGTGITNKLTPGRPHFGSLPVPAGIAALPQGGGLTISHNTPMNVTVNGAVGDPQQLTNNFRKAVDDSNKDAARRTKDDLKTGRLR